jgi:hypothetical protein
MKWLASHFYRVIASAWLMLWFLLATCYVGELGSVEPFSKWMPFEVVLVHGIGVVLGLLAGIEHER